MVDIKEALAALDKLQREWPFADTRAIYDCLQSVAQEREDWETIRAWASAVATRDAYLIVLTPGYKFLLDDPRMIPRHMTGATRAEALSKAATWAREEMAK